MLKKSSMFVSIKNLNFENVLFPLLFMGKAVKIRSAMFNTGISEIPT